MGIYDHIPGDGREYVLTDPSALKIYAEDGRPVSELDLSPFFRYLPGGTELKCFSTPHASGSVSQAANIIEAVCAESKLLLIDEDKSATNFMIRDKNMRRIVKNEPIIPFTDRIRELYEQIGVSTILVIGGSSEYLSYADTVILMDDYLPRVLTEEIESLELGEQGNESCFAVWTHKRRIIPKKTSQPFLYVKNVVTENEKKIILDEHSADITLLTALFSGEQLNTLACVMEHLLTDKEADSSELIERVGECVSKLFLETETVSLVPEAAQRFYEDIRPIDAFCCVNRMRGLHFKTVEGDA
jgi:predicted ABC-class ATPase